jgi:WD40 repeat protein
MADVFVSYSRKDTDFVKVLNQALNRSKFETWIDWQDIPLTADWWEEIKRGIEAADNFIFVISPDSIASKVCHQEVDHAAQHNKRIIPVLRREGFDDVFMHEGLSRHNWLFFRPADDFDRAFQQLVTAINLDLPYVRTHTRLLTRAVEWEQSQRRDDLLLRGQDLQEAEHWLAAALANQQEPWVAELHKIFLTKSREVETANQRLLEAGDRARRQVQFGVAVLGLTLAAAAGVGFLAVRAYSRLNHAQVQALITEADTAYTANPRALDALSSSLQAADVLQRQWLVSDRSDLEHTLASTILKANYGIAEVERLVGHTDSVRQVMTTADGQRLIASSADGTVSLWDHSGTELRRLEGHTDWVREARLSPDGSFFATASDDFTVRFWTPDGDFIRSFQPHEEWVYSLDFSPDGRTWATASEDGTVKLWTLDGKLLKTLIADSDLVRVVRFLANGQFATAGSDGIIRLWDAQGNPLADWPAHNGEITALAVGPGGQPPTSATPPWLASTGRDGTVKLWAPGRPTPIRTLTTPRDRWGKSDELWSVAFSPNGDWIAAAGQWAQIYLWRADGTLVDILTGHEDRILSVTFSPDGQELFSAGDDNTIRLWRWPNPALIPLTWHQQAAYEAAISRDGQRIAIASKDGTVSLWDLEGRRLRTLNGFADSVGAVAFGPNGMIAAVDDTGQVGLWSSPDQAATFFPAHRASIRDIAFSPNQSLFATASDDGQIKLWSPTSLDAPLATLMGHDGPVYALHFRADGRQLASVGEDGTARLWNVQGQQQQALQVSESPLFNVRFSPDATHIIATGEDTIGHLWRLRDGIAVARLEGHTAPIWGAAFSPDGQRIATASDDTTVRLWHLDGRAIITLTGHTDEVNSVQFSPDGQRLVSASSDGRGLLWDVADVSLASLTDRGCHWFAKDEGGSRLDAVAAACDRRTR